MVAFWKGGAADLLLVQHTCHLFVILFADRAGQLPGITLPLSYLLVMLDSSLVLPILCFNC